MAGNLYFRRQAAQPIFYQRPLEVLRDSLEQKTQRYNAYQALSSDLSNLQINALDQDRATANTIIQGFQGDIDKAVDSAGGDYSNIGDQLHKIGRSISKELSPGNAGYEIATRKAKFDAQDNMYKEMLAKGIMPERQYSAWKKYAMDNYGGIGTKNPNTGLFNSFDIPQAAKAFEVGDLVDQFASKIIPHQFSSGSWKKGKDGTIYEYSKNGRQVVTPDRIRAVVQQGLDSHQGWNTYAGQMTEFGDGITQQEINGAIDRAIDTYAFDNRSHDENIRFTPKHLLGGGKEELSVNSNLKAYRDPLTRTGGKASMINTNKIMGGDIPTMVPVTPGNPLSAVNALISGGKALRNKGKRYEIYKAGQETGFITNSLADGSFAEQGGDIKMMKGIMGHILKSPDNPNGLDEKNPDDAKAIYDYYNKTMESMEMYQPLSYQINNPELRDELKDTYFNPETMAIMNTQGVSATEGGGQLESFVNYMQDFEGVRNSKNPAKVKADIMEKMFDDNGNFNPGYGFINFESATNGRVPFGMQLQTPNGTYVFQMNDEQANEAYRGVYEMSKIKQDPEAEVSEPYFDRSLNMVLRSRKMFNFPQYQEVPTREQLLGDVANGGIIVTRLTQNQAGNMIEEPMPAWTPGGPDTSRHMTLQNLEDMKHYQGNFDQAMPRARGKVYPYAQQKD